MYKLVKRAGGLFLGKARRPVGAPDLPHTRTTYGSACVSSMTGSTIRPSTTRRSASASAAVIEIDVWRTSRSIRSPYCRGFNLQAIHFRVSTFSRNCCTHADFPGPSRPSGIGVSESSNNCSASRSARSSQASVYLARSSGLRRS